MSQKDPPKNRRDLSRRAELESDLANHLQK